MHIFFNEASVLKNLSKYNFIHKIIASFHDYDNLYFVSKYYEQKTFNYLDKNWNESQLRFFSACLIQTLLYLRKNQIIHRDIHFGNLVFDKDKYIILIDYHVAIEYQNKNNHIYDIVGSPELCAPEMINLSTYDYNSDYYRLGGMIYYIIFKKFPNYIKFETNLKDIIINPHEIKNYSFSCIDFINKLLINNYTKRIGFNNIDELKRHNFFKNFNWKDFINKKMKSPFRFIPIKNIGMCEKKYNFSKKIIMNIILNNHTLRNIFFNYDYVNVEEIYL